MMVGGLEACGRVAAVALLAVSSVVPHGDSAAAVPEPAPLADVVTACSVTVGTATTDPALATDAARALAAGYAVTDCVPSADLLAAAEARAALSLPPAPLGGDSVVGGAVVGTSSGTAAGPTATTTQGTATVASTPTTSAVPTTSTVTAAETTTPTSTTPTSTETTTALSTPTGGSSTADGGTGDDGSTGSSDGEFSGDSGGDSSGDSGGDSGDDSGGRVDDGGTSPDDAAPDGTTTAAGRYGWGRATRSEDFDGDLSAWDALDGPGQAGDGSRSPAALGVAGGVVTLSGDAAGTTGGLAWRGGATYGRWEARLKAPAGDPTYHAVLRLSPDADDPTGAVDVVDIGDGARQKADFVLQDGDSDPLHGQVAIDATRWHDWAVEWAPDHITAYVDGQEWYTTRDTDAFPPGPLHLALQLDWLPTAGDAVQPSTMSVDWVRYYPLAVEGTGAADIAGATTTTTAAPTTTATTTSALTTTTADTTVTATSTGDPEENDGSDG
jgi:hypothetical protein